MWFEPLNISHSAKPIANLANTANYQSDIGSKQDRISGISRISSEVTKKSHVTCGQCLHFKCNNSHGAGAGSCLVGGAYGAWSETQHQCSKFDAAVEWVEMPDPKPDAIMVIVYTPNGNAIEIEARDEAHAVWLQQMNPKLIQD